MILAVKINFKANHTLYIILKIHIKVIAKNAQLEKHVNFSFVLKTAMFI